MALGEEYLSVLVQEIGWLLQLLTRQCLLMEGYPVQGDNATIVGISTPRPLTAPWLSSTIHIGTSGGQNI